MPEPHSVWCISVFLIIQDRKNVLNLVKSWVCSASRFCGSCQRAALPISYCTSYKNKFPLNTKSNSFQLLSHCRCRQEGCTWEIVSSRNSLRSISIFTFKWLEWNTVQQDVPWDEAIDFYPCFHRAFTKMASAPTSYGNSTPKPLGYVFD